MNKLIGIVFAILSILMLSCIGSKQDAGNSETIDPQLASGFKLLQTNCFSCHDPNGNAEKRIAPTLESIKEHYVSEGVKETEFAADLFDYVNFPNPEKSKMQGALRVFGLMPKLDVSENHMKDIAAYLYRTPVEEPNWYTKEFKKEIKKYKDFKLPESTNSLEKAKSHAMATKAILGKNLLNAIQTKGPEGAVSFCSEKAYHLVDSMAIAQGVKIKRVSDLNRNPENKANSQEHAYINRMKEIISKGEVAISELSSIGDSDVAYIPIMTNEMCLQCHGSIDNHINEPTMKKIKSIYPDDLATGYDVEQIRGIWVVEMLK